MDEYTSRSVEWTGKTLGKNVHNTAQKHLAWGPILRNPETSSQGKGKNELCKSYCLLSSKPHQSLCAPWPQASDCVFLPTSPFMPHTSFLPLLGTALSKIISTSLNTHYSKCRACPRSMKMPIVLHEGNTACGRRQPPSPQSWSL